MTYTTNTNELNEFKCVASKRLRDANIPTDNIAIPLKPESKKATLDFTDKKNRRDLNQNIGNYGILAKGRLHFIDIDDMQEAPEDLIKNTVDTFSVSSPHGDGEHRWIVSQDVLPNKKPNWGEIRSQNQYVVGPGSILHDCKHGCCSSDNPGIYSIKNNAPIQEVTKDELSDWVGGFEKDTVDGFSEDIELGDLEGSERLATAEEILKELQKEHTAFFSDLMDRLNGGRGNMGERLSKESGKINTSQLDFVTLEHLYGVFKNYGKSHDESRGLAVSVYTYYSQETPYTKDGQKKKWEKRDRRYQIDMLNNAVAEFDEHKFLRLLNQSNGSRKNLNEYPKITYKIADFVIDWLTNDWSIDEAQDMAKVGYQLDIEESDLVAVSKQPMYQDTTPLSMGSNECEYPSPKAVRQICFKIDNRGIETYKSVVRRLRRDGHIKLAYLGGNDWRVYQSHLPNPPEAKKIKCSDETYKNPTVESKATKKVKV